MPAMPCAGLVMLWLYFHGDVASCRRSKQAVAAKDPQAGGVRLGKMRHLVGISLILGLIVVAIGSGGRYL